jgi:hypothetical protein
MGLPERLMIHPAAIQETQANLASWKANRTAAPVKFQH